MLKTERTKILPLEESHFDEVLSMYNEPDTWEYITPHKNKTNEYYLNFLTKKVNDNKTDLGFWSVYSIDNNEFIGTVNLNHYKGSCFKHIGCHLSNKYWNKGYAYELMFTLKKYALNELNLSEVYGLVEDKHQVSKKLMAKLNFKLEKQETIDGVLLNFFEYNQNGKAV